MWALSPSPPHQAGDPAERAQLGTGGVKGKTKPEQVLQAVPKTAEENRTSRRGLWAGRSQLAGTASPLAQDRASEQLQDDERPGGAASSAPDQPRSSPRTPPPSKGIPSTPGRRWRCETERECREKFPSSPGPLAPAGSRVSPLRARPGSPPASPSPLPPVRFNPPGVLTGLSAPCAPPGLC